MPAGSASTSPTATQIKRATAADASVLPSPSVADCGGSVTLYTPLASALPSKLSVSRCQSSSHWTSLGVTDPVRVRRAAEDMLSGPSPVTAIFTGNNRVTVTVIRVLAEHTRRVALVGFDDIELADLLQPGVTVVAQDAATLGRTAAERLFRQLDGSLLTPERIELPTRLITRGSGELPPAD